MNSEHGGCIMVPREDGYTRYATCLYFTSSRSKSFDDDDRIYTKLSAERVAELAKDHRESGGRVDVHSITAEEVLEQTNKVFAPYKVRFASALAWFAVWKSKSSFPFSHHPYSQNILILTFPVSERVARFFSSPDLRVHLGGDAAQVTPSSILSALPSTKAPH